MLAADVLLPLLDRHAPWRPCSRAPALCAWQADDEIPLWQALEHAAGQPLGVPYFAIAWPAALLVAGLLLEGRIDVRGRSVADVGCGSGLVACAALRAGARRAMAVDIDALAVLAAVELGRRHGVAVEAYALDPLNQPQAIDADVVICADLVSRQAQRGPFADAVALWHSRGAEVLLADSGRPFFDAQGMAPLHEEQVEVSSRVDGAGTRTVRLYGGGAPLTPRR